MNDIVKRFRNCTIKRFQPGGKTNNKDLYIKSLDAWIAKHPTYRGLNTADFRDFLIELVQRESNYNPNAVQGSYKGWYQVKNPSKTLHNSAFNHLANLFLHNITKEDLQMAKLKNISPSALLLKFWNQLNYVPDYLYYDIDHSDGLGTKISEYGNDMTSNVDYSRYLPDAVTDDYVIAENHKSFADAAKLNRNEDTIFADRLNSLIRINRERNSNFNPDKIQVGDTIYLRRLFPIHLPILIPTELDVTIPEEFIPKYNPPYFGI